MSERTNPLHKARKTVEIKKCGNTIKYTVPGKSLGAWNHPVKKLRQAIIQKLSPSEKPAAPIAEKWQ